MIEFYGNNPPNNLSHIELGGNCPHCGTGSKYIRTTDPKPHTLNHNDARTVVIDYICAICRESVPVSWVINNIDNKSVIVGNPKYLLRNIETFNFEFVPEKIKTEISEALDCLSVNAYNGFAAVCRRAIQAITTNLGAKSTSKVKNKLLK